MAVLKLKYVPDLNSFHVENFDSRFMRKNLGRFSWLRKDYQHLHGSLERYYDDDISISDMTFFVGYRPHFLSNLIYIFYKYDFSPRVFSAFSVHNDFRMRRNIADLFFPGCFQEFDPLLSRDDLLYIKMTDGFSDSVIFGNQKSENQ